MSEIDSPFLKTWREKYRWPFNASRNESEQKILRLERLVSDNILRRGVYTCEYVLSQIIDWKTSGRQVARFSENSPSKIRLKVDRVLEMLHSDPDRVTENIRAFAIDDKLQGVGIPVASTFLRFLDPINHRYGIIDKNIASLLNEEKVANFEFENGLLVNTVNNADEYQRFHFWLRKKAADLGSSTFTNIYNLQSKWTPVDIEMALFTYCTRKFTDSLKGEDSPHSEKTACPKCGSPLKWHTAERTGEGYRGCTNYPECKYNERSY